MIPEIWSICRSGNGSPRILSPILNSSKKRRDNIVRYAIIGSQDTGKQLLVEYLPGKQTQLKT